MADHEPRPIVDEIAQERLAQAVPDDRVAAMARRLVFRQLDGINVIGDRLRYAPDDHEAIVRLAGFVDALRWNGNQAVALTWQYARGKLTMPEDAFAPALVLTLLDPGAPLQSWIEGLGAESHRALDVLAEVLRRFRRRTLSRATASQSTIGVTEVVPTGVE